MQHEFKTYLLIDIFWYFLMRHTCLTWRCQLQCLSTEPVSDIPLTINNPSELNPHPIWPQGANLPREAVTSLSQSEASVEASWPMRGQTAKRPPSLVPCDHSTLWCSTLPDNWIETVTKERILMSSWTFGSIKCMFTLLFKFAFLGKFCQA